MAFRPGGDMIPQLDGQIERLKRKENLSEAEIIELCKTATKVLLSEQNMRNELTSQTSSASEFAKSARNGVDAMV